MLVPTVQLFVPSCVQMRNDVMETLELLSDHYLANYHFEHRAERDGIKPPGCLQKIFWADAYLHDFCFSERFFPSR